MKIKKYLICFLFVLSLFISFVNAGSWYQYGSDKEGSFVYDSSSYRVTGENPSWFTSTENSKNISYTQPLIADLDDDGLNEIIIVEDNYILLFGGTDYHFIDSYATDINIYCRLNVLDWDEDGTYEIIYSHETSSSDITALSWNGTDFIEKKNIMTDNFSFHMADIINCADLWGDSSKECCVNNEHGLSCGKYNDSEFDFKYVYSGNDIECDKYLRNPILSFIDYDDDGDLDIYLQTDYSVPAPGLCGRMKLLKNNGDGTFTYQYTISSTSDGISQIAKANLDDGIKELIVTASYYCYHPNNGCQGGSGEYQSNLRIFNIETGSLNCMYEFNNGLYNYNISPYLTGLHTCYGQEHGLDCDYNNDGFDDIYVFAYYPSLLKPTLNVFNKSCSLLYSHIIDEINVLPTTESYNTRSPVYFANGIWSNFDADSAYEFYFYDTIINKDGSVVKHFYDTFKSEYSGVSYLTIGDLTGDYYDEIIKQNGTTNIVIMSSISSCTDSDNGLNYNVQGTVIAGDISKTDSCANEYTVREYYCDAEEEVGYDYELHTCPNTCINGTCEGMAQTYLCNQLEFAEYFAYSNDYFTGHPDFNGNFWSYSNQGVSSDPNKPIASKDDSAFGISKYVDNTYVRRIYFANDILDLTGKIYVTYDTYHSSGEYSSFKIHYNKTNGNDDWITVYNAPTDSEILSTYLDLESEITVSVEGNVPTCSMITQHTQSNWNTDWVTIEVEIDTDNDIVSFFADEISDGCFGMEIPGLSSIISISMDMTQIDGEYSNKYIDNIKVCQAVETGEISCSDTDGGFNVNEKGTITADTNIRNDSCADGFQLREYICNPEEPLGFSYSTYYCLGGCSEGKCIIPQGAVCYNYDTGQYVNESYRYCSQDYAKECLAGGFWDSEFCPLGCLNGECASSTCSDTDDGTDIYVKGTVTFLGNISTDYCQGEFNLTEFKCYKPLNEPYEMRSEQFVCDVGCLNGACIGFEGIEGLFRIGEPCNNNGECISGNCEYSFCAYKGGAEDCLRNDQCLSNKCINSKCTKPSYWQSVDASKTQQFGNDSHSNNFVALFLIIGITGILGFSTKSVLVSGGTLYGLSIFFTIVGWLSAFILLGFIIAGLVFVVFMFIGKGSGG